MQSRTSSEEIDELMAAMLVFLQMKSKLINRQPQPNQYTPQLPACALEDGRCDML